MKIIEILLKPSYHRIITELGYDENEDYNEDDILHQQGYNTEILEIIPGEEFSIDLNYENGYLDNPEDKYKLIFKKNEEEWDGENDDWEEENRNSESIIFYQGNYILNEDGVTFEKI